MISSRYIMHQLRCSSPRQDSINLRKVAGALVSPKGILSHSQNPSGCMVNTVRVLASSSNSTCQYPDFRSKVENQTAPCRQFKVSSILGNAYPSLTVWFFNLCRSMQTLRPPSFFLTRTTALVHGLKLLLIAPTSTMSRRSCFTSSKRWGGILLYLFLNGLLSVNLILCFSILHFPKSKSFLENISE